jgi:hypothetical protein
VAWHESSTRFREGKLKTRQINQIGEALLSHGNVFLCI